MYILGKKQWSRKRIILWQAATLIDDPIIIALMGGIALPGVILDALVWAGRKIYKKNLTNLKIVKQKRNILVTLGFVGSVIA